MKLASKALLKAAERVTRAGPKPGLAVWRRLAASSDDPELVAQAVITGLGLAVTTGDAEVAHELATRWAWARPEEGGAAFELVAMLMRARYPVAARALAEGEHQRQPSSRASWVLARCLGRRDARSAALFHDAARWAEREGDVVLARAARVRGVRLRFERSATREAALEEAKAIDMTDATADERLLLAPVLLAGASRFVRARGLALLDDVVALAPDGGRGSDRQAARRRRALKLAAHHVDTMGTTLSMLEVDRARALFSRSAESSVPSAARLAFDAQRAMAEAKDDDSLRSAMQSTASFDPPLARLQERADDLVRGRFEAHREDDPTLAAWTRLGHATLDAAFALRDQRSSHAVAAFASMTSLAARAAFVPASAWVVVERGLTSDASELRNAALALAATMVDRTESAAPPDAGWVRVASLCDALGADDLAITMLERARKAREPEAERLLAEALRRWAFAHSSHAGDTEEPSRLRALEGLRRARDLLTPHPASAKPT